MKNLYKDSDWIDINERQKIGEILMQAGCMELKHLAAALEIQKFQKLHIGEILVSLKIITADQLGAALELQKKINAKFI